jgi:two-component system OmpR family response regulator
VNVLLVEDNVILGDAVRDHVFVKGHSVEWCLTLADATAAMESGHFGLVLLDLRLPDGSGLSLIQGLRSRQDTVPIIILTAHDQISDQIGGLAHGASDYLVKPFGLSELDQRMTAVIRRSDKIVPVRHVSAESSGLFA